jgi:hypothetical protein
MKTILSFSLLAVVFMATGICAGQAVDLRGNWTGSGSGYIEDNGSARLMDEGIINLIISKQEGSLFTGNVIYKINGTEIVEGFAGAIGADNKTLYLVEFNSGSDLGTIISEDAIEMVYIEDGEPTQISLERFYRVKE